MESGELQAILHELKEKLSSLYGDRLADLILYGSQARGDAEDGSDIDVLIVLRDNVISPEDTQKARDIVYELSYDHNTVVRCVCLDHKTFSRGQGPLVRNVLREGIKL